MKPTIMILGSHHMANPDVNTISFDTDDVLAPKRQPRTSATRRTTRTIQTDEDSH